MDKFNYWMVPIRLFTERIIDFKLFESIWISLMANHAGYEDFSEERKDLIDDINDRIGFAAENPTELDRKDGYISAEEFVNWLKQKK